MVQVKGEVVKECRKVKRTLLNFAELCWNFTEEGKKREGLRARFKDLFGLEVGGRRGCEMKGTNSGNKLGSIYGSESISQAGANQTDRL